LSADVEKYSTPSAVSKAKVKYGTSLGWKETWWYASVISSDTIQSCLRAMRRSDDSDSSLHERFWQCSFGQRRSMTRRGLPLW
jgi:hypothetical protein